ncbi:MAG: hypothetical protein KAI43_12985 [Candidatus Aureabacteria bacterium]|nr:hypothetical protein [Candidatus Auribacterota bacterium]
MIASSPYISSFPEIDVYENGPSLIRPSKDDSLTFENKAEQIINNIISEQKKESLRFSLEWMKDRHFLLIGATGYGLGACIACKLIEQLSSGSVTIVSRDLKNSLSYHTAIQLKKNAEKKGIAFEWLNTGISTNGKGFTNISQALTKLKAKKNIYINTVAYAFSGVLPGYPPIFIKDLDENEKLIQWKLETLNEKQISVNNEIMGLTSINLPGALKEQGINIDMSVFSDWRGSLDKISRLPEMYEYGRQGAYSTSLHIPKKIIQERINKDLFLTKDIMLDAFYPIMDTPALLFLPGGHLIKRLMNKIMKKSGVNQKKVSLLALELLDYLGKVITNKKFNPFPRFDLYESQFDLEFFYMLEKINNSSNSPFYYKNWI